MSEEDVIDRWVQRGWERLRGVTGRGARTAPSPLSAEAYDLLRQVERGLELRAKASAPPRPPTGTMLDEVSSLAPLSTGLRRVRKAARPRPGDGAVGDGVDEGDD